VRGEDHRAAEALLLLFDKASETSMVRAVNFAETLFERFTPERRCERTVALSRVAPDDPPRRVHVRSTGHRMRIDVILRAVQVDDVARSLSNEHACALAMRGPVKLVDV
jgi:hypothetical protein